MAQLRAFDAIPFGAVGAPDVPDHLSLWKHRLAIRQLLVQFSNVRPTRILVGIDSGDLNWVVVRQNSDGENAGQGGRSRRDLPQEVATEVSIFTRIDITPIMRFVVQLVRPRPPKQLTVVTKSSAQRHCLVVWDDIAAEGSQECPDVKWDSMPVDQLRQVRLTG